MKIIIDGADLKKLYDRMKVVVLQSSSLPMLRNVKIVADPSGIHAYGTNNEDYIISDVYGDVIEPGEIYIEIIDFKLISGITGEITITSKNGFLDVRNSKKSYAVPYNEIDEFVDFPNVDSKVICEYDEGQFIHHLSVLDLSRSLSDTHLLMTCFHFDLMKQRICTLDGHRIGIAHLESGIPAQDVEEMNVSGNIYKVLKALRGRNKNDTNINIYSNDKYIKFIGEDYIYISRLYEGIYYDIDKLMYNSKDSYDYKYSVNSKELGGIGKEYAKMIKTESKPMIFSNYNGVLKTGINVGKYRTTDLLESVDAKVGMEHEFVIGINPHFVSDACKVFDDNFDIVGSYQSIRPVIFSNHTYDVLLLPINIGNSDTNMISYIRVS